jgi:hypothetical protein
MIHLLEGNQGVPESPKSGHQSRPPPRKNRAVFTRKCQFKKFLMPTTGSIEDCLRTTSGRVPAKSQQQECTVQKAA